MGAVVPERPLDPAEPARRLGLGWRRRSGSPDERSHADRGAVARRRSGARRGEAEVRGLRRRQGRAAVVGGAARHWKKEKGA